MLLPTPEVISLEQPLAESLTSSINQATYSKLILVWDASVYHLWYEKLGPALPPHICMLLPAGEQHKHLGTVEYLYRCLLQAEADRNSLLIAIGGGVTTDLAAFVADTWKRGIRFWLVPTTLLAMVDAAYGGKTGVDFGNAKNLIGTFATPQRLLIHPSWLETLPQRERRSGLAEMLKHALIADAPHWQVLSSMPPHSLPDTSLIEHSLAIKQAIVADDPLEQGARKALNFGHTLGHALESARMHTSDRLLHGEAVAIGMLLAIRLSEKRLGFSSEEAKRVEETLLRLGFPLRLGIATDAVLPFLQQDKKNFQGELRFVLLEAPGRVRIDIAIQLEDVVDVLENHLHKHG